MTNMNAERNTRMLEQHSPLAVEFAAHLERAYGLQLDDMRHKALVVEIEARDAAVIQRQRDEFAARYGATIAPASKPVLNILEFGGNTIMPDGDITADQIVEYAERVLAGVDLDAPGHASGGESELVKEFLKECTDAN